MPSDNVQRFRMKAHCVVQGFPGWEEGRIYDGREGTGQVRTVELRVPECGKQIEVLRGSVVEVTEFGGERV